MSWKSEAHRIYEERVINDALTRLAEQLDVGRLPFSPEELKTLAKRSRESFRNSAKGGERLARYIAHLARAYDADLVAKVATALEDINNQIGYEEK
jgi:hypothetical protein